MRNWRLLIELVRPPFMIFTFWVLAAGVITTGSFSLSMVPQLLVYTVLGHLAIFSVNDYFDRDTDQENDRKGGLEGAVVNSENEEFVKYTVIASHLMLGAIALFLPAFSAFSAVIVLTASFLYSAPPFRLKEKPFVDSMCNVAILYFTFGVGVGLAGGGLGDIIPGAFWFALIFGGPGHMAASYVDRESDKKAGMRTSAIVLGRRGIVLLAQALIAASLYFQEWSDETSTLLSITFLFTLYPLITEKDVKKVLYLWASVTVLYIVYWFAVRI